MKRLALLPFLLAASCAHHEEHTEAVQGRKMMSLLEKFDRFDYDGNGSLTRKEIAEGVTEAGAGTTKLTPAELDTMMKHYDVNKDGKVTRWEAERVIDLPVPEVH